MPRVLNFPFIKQNTDKPVSLSNSLRGTYQTQTHALRSVPSGQNGFNWSSLFSTAPVKFNFCHGPTILIYFWDCPLSLPHLFSQNDLRIPSPPPHALHLPTQAHCFLL